MIRKFQGRLRLNKKPGWQRLEEDVAALEKHLFEGGEGRFNMHLWGQSEDKNLCNTSACMAGWLGMLSKNGFDAVWEGDDSEGFALSAAAATTYGNFTSQAMYVYDMTMAEANYAFVDAMNTRPVNKKFHLDRLKRVLALVKERAGIVDQPKVVEQPAALEEQAGVYLDFSKEKQPA